jgi:hypothetical protein
MPVKSVILVIVAAAFAALAAPLVARAQDATPVVGSLAPAPEECTVAPITAERLNLVIAGASATGTPEAVAEASPIASPTAFTMPEGTPADEATYTAISAAVREYIACINAGDVAKALALYSDTGLSDILAGAIAQGATGEQILASFGTPAPLPPDQVTRLYGIDAIVIMPDGRAAALVIGDDLTKPSPPGPALIYFVQVNGAWLVDGFIPTEQIVTS